MILTHVKNIHQKNLEKRQFWFTIKCVSAKTAVLWKKKLIVGANYQKHATLLNNKVEKVWQKSLKTIWELYRYLIKGLVSKLTRFSFLEFPLKNSENVPNLVMITSVTLQL